MNEQQSDFEWLQQFARAGSQTAFRDIVRRHIDLVFATALRKTGDAGGAEEVAQNIFGALARKAWQFGPDDSLPAWLYKSTLLESQTWLRGELRRRRREQTAAELGTVMRTPNEPAAFNALEPLLDEALLSLREKDRTALLLRFYEKQPFRDVGGRLGISEDAAQKRVSAALEKLSQFFQRRGYKTATLAVTAAVLQHTAASASAATTSLVLDAALKSAPVALAGFSARLAHFASLTQVQTAAVCLAVAAIPVGWKAEQAHETAQAAAALQQKVAALQSERSDSGDELNRLRERSVALEQKQSASALVQARQEAAGRQLKKLEARGRALLAADDYRWPDDLPFVRVPKSALASLEVGGGPNSPEKLAAKVDQYLDLTPREHELTSQIFSNYFAEIDHLFETSLYETNRPSSLSLPPSAESTVFVLLPMGGKIRAALDQLCASLEAALGGERWSMIKPDDFEFTHYEQVRLLGYTTFNWDQQQEFAVSVFPNSRPEPMISWRSGDGTGCSPFPLRYVLSGSTSSLMLPQGPPILMDRIAQYCFAQAKARANPATK